MNQLTREENLFLAKKYFVELVYNAAYIEGCNVTFPQTQTIIDGAVINNVLVSDIQTVLNLRDGWQFILNTIDTPVTLDYICKVNEYVSRNESLEWGSLRTGNVGISGTDWKPPIPNDEYVIKQLEKINSIENTIERSLEYFCYGTKSQLFWDGNKRTSTMIASKMLIADGQGVLTIDKNNALEFNAALLHYYNTDDQKPLCVCLKKCIKTLSRNKSIINTRKCDKGLER